MAYRGITVPVAFGTAGIESDIAQVLEHPVLYSGSTSIVSLPLQVATNVQASYGSIEKEPGTLQWNNSALPAGVVAFYDWWPDDQNQRLIVCCKDGKIYRFTDKSGYTEVKAQSGSQETLIFSPQTCMVSGGAEQAGRPRKLFIISGNDPVQVINGDGTTRHDLSNPTPEWFNPNNPTVHNWPRSGIINNGSFFLFGNDNNRHTIYQSDISDHENFDPTDTATKIYSIFPGEYERIIALAVYKTRLMVLKYPLGVYYLDDVSGLVQKLTESIGGASPHCMAGVVDDLLIANQNGSVTSIKAVLSLGGLEQGDLFKQLRCSKYIQENVSPDGLDSRWVIYYEDKKKIMVVFRGPSSYFNDKIVTIDYHTAAPTVTWSDFTGNHSVNCIGLVKDIRKVNRPFCGADDGYLYSMDSAMRSRGGVGFTSIFQTPHMDFSWVDKKFQELDKIFDFFSITTESVGSWNISVDVFSDGRYVETVQTQLTRTRHMDGAFKLDQDHLSGTSPIPSRLVPIHATGKRISLRLTQEVSNQNFKISSIQFYFRPGGTANRAGG